MLRTSSLLLVSLLPSFSNAYTWQWTSTPQQCQNVSLSIQGNDGKPPYSLLLIPSGPSPLPNNIEARTLQTIPFQGSDTTLSFKLNYPANSAFVAVVSDSNGSNGFGSGGTTLPITVGDSSDSSCFNSKQTVQGPWVFSINPTGGLTQCQPTRLWWEQSNVQGSVNFVGVIPGGNSFQIPQGPLSTNQDTGTGFNWTVDVRGGTNMLIIAGDNRGLGAGGSAPFTVNYPTDNSNSCIQNDSPSSTAGSAAGGSPTSSSASSPTSSGGSSSSGGSNTGAIVGGVVGGVGGAIALTAIALFFIRRRSRGTSTKERPVDLLQENEDSGADDHLPQYYQPEPFLVPDPTVAATSDAGSIYHGEDGTRQPGMGSRRPSSFGTTTDGGFLRPGTPGASSIGGTSRKSPNPPVMRPVNIIQHDDAGPSGQDGGEAPETIELPPAYTNIRTAASPEEPAGNNTTSA